MREPAPSVAVVTSLDRIADGQALDGLAAPAIVALYERAAMAEARLRARMLTLAPDTNHASASEADRVLGVKEAAGMLGMTKDYLYRHWARLGLAYKDSDGHLKFPLSKIERYIRMRAGR